VDHFAELKDPRVERTKRHPLLSILAIAICAVVIRAETWDEIEEFGTVKEKWFAEFLDLPTAFPPTTPSIACSRRWIPSLL
jgi:hypothetical protein